MTMHCIFHILYWYISYIFKSRCRVPVSGLFDNVIKLPGVNVLINKVTKTYVSMINEDWTGLFEILIRGAVIYVKNLQIQYFVMKCIGTLFYG